MAIPFVQARWFTPTNGRNIRLIVIHDMEAPETLLTAENTAHFFQTTTRKASAHYCLDNNSIVQCVRDKDIAYHAPGANSDGIGYEHAGYARQSRAEWLDAYSSAELRLSATLAAQHCQQFGLPVEFIQASRLPTGAKGITTHWEVTKAYKKSTHTDPGPNFPMDVYLNWVREAMGGSLPAPVPPQPAPTNTAKEQGMWLIPVEEGGAITWRTLSPTGLRHVASDTAAQEAWCGMPVYGGSVNKGVHPLVACAVAISFGAPLISKDGTVVKP